MLLLLLWIFTSPLLLLPEVPFIVSFLAASSIRIDASVLWWRGLCSCCRCFCVKIPIKRDPSLWKIKWRPFRHRVHGWRGTGLLEQAWQHHCTDKTMGETHRVYSGYVDFNCATMFPGGVIAPQPWKIRSGNPEWWGQWLWWQCCYCWGCCWGLYDIISSNASFKVMFDALQRPRLVCYTTSHTLRWEWSKRATMKTRLIDITRIVSQLERKWVCQLNVASWFALDKELLAGVMQWSLLRHYTWYHIHILLKDRDGERVVLKIFSVARWHIWDELQSRDRDDNSWLPNSYRFARDMRVATRYARDIGAGEWLWCQELKREKTCFSWKQGPWSLNMNASALNEVIQNWVRWLRIVSSSWLEETSWRWPVRWQHHHHHPMCLVPSAARNCRVSCKRQTSFSLDECLNYII